MHAQRAAEKAIKAVFEEQQLEIPPRERKTHSIEALVGKLNLPVVPPKLSNAFVLTKYAVDTHYIDDLGDPLWVKDQEIAPAVQLAEAVVEWAASVIEDSEA